MSLKIKVVVCALDKMDKIDGLKTVRIQDLSSVVRKYGLSDVKVNNACKFLRYYHYQRNGADFYMLNNENVTETADTILTFSAFKGGKYLEYDPFSNKAVVKNSKDGLVKLSLSSYNTVILAFNDVSLDGAEEFISKKVVESTPINITFKVSTKDCYENEFKYYKTSDKLFNVTGKDENCYFSGDVLYEGEFNLDNEGKYYLDLGNVGEIAKVTLNGVDVGLRMFPPYEFDISDAVKVGKNQLEVLTTSHSAYLKRDPFSRYLLFEPSGLLGPISLKNINNNLIFY